MVARRVRLAAERHGVKLEPLDGSENGPESKLVEGDLVRNRLDPVVQPFAIYRDKRFMVAGQLNGKSMRVSIPGQRATLAPDFAGFR
jgi:hypothetical protein